MRKMPGMEALVRAKNTTVEGMSFVRDDGRPYGIIKPTGNPDQQAIISEFEIFRGDLAEILVGFTEKDENVKYVYGEQIASMQQSGEGNGPVKVEFQNGLPTAEYDLVVACDGATSRTRAMGYGCGVRDHIVSVNIWASYFTVEEDLLKGSKVGNAVSAPGGRALMMGPDPTGVTRVTMMNVSPMNGTDATLPFREAQKAGDAALRNYITECYGDVGWLAPTVLAGMQTTDDFYASDIVQVRAPSITKGRLALVGDAGYATGPTGAGTSIALTGAYVLAGEIGKHKGDLAAGLKAYEETMKPFIKEMSEIPPFVMTILAPQTSWGIWIRNHIFMVVAWSGVVNFVQKHLASSFGSSDKFPLPKYECLE